MMSITDSDSKPKRKNDDKAKGRPRSRALLAGLVTVLLIAGVALWIALRPDPVLSPQYPAASLVFNTDREGGRFSRNLQTHTYARLSDQAIPAYQAPSLSPDGQWQVMWQPTGAEAEWDLILQPMQTTESPRILGRFFHAGGSPLWSADSQQIIFTAAPGLTKPSTVPWMEQDLVVFNLETNTSEVLLKQSGQEHDAAFSPDGQHIVYVANHCSANCLYVMDLATRESELLIYDTEHMVGDPAWWPNASDPVWSPDGQWIAFASKDPIDRYAIWIIRPDGTDAENISGWLARYYGNPQWLP